MTPPSNLNKVKLALRSELCVECKQRDKTAQLLPSDAAKCEPVCTLFANLQRLAQLAKDGEPPCGYDVFSKSLQQMPNEPAQYDLVLAMNIIEAAVSSTSQANSADNGCKCINGAATTFACQTESKVRTAHE